MMSLFRKLILSVSVFIILIISNCDKEVPITKFEDDFKEYESEPRIEAILNTTNLSESIVRIDRTILVTDTELYDGEDNDGDWTSYEDLNGNGKWDDGEPLNDDIGDDPDGEAGLSPAQGGRGDGQPTEGEPHIDELDEILPQVHDSTYEVVLYEKVSGKKIIDFKWSHQADDFQYVENPDTEVEETVHYGGYIPDQIYIDKIDYSKTYEFEFSKDDTVITGEVSPLKPPVFQTLSDAKRGGDTLIIERGKGGKLVWTTEEKATVFWIIARRIYSPDSVELVENMPMTPIAQNEDGSWLGKDFPDIQAPGLYKWEVVVPSRKYGHYFYSSLPIRDKELNNLRDHNGKVVLGIAGSVSVGTIYVRVVNGDD
ncbi:MAG: hypothetical protein K9M80_08600 [Candidatus Marinimicrobia bacterium]|nr:hypothetical protein [Candidatus Neomarinimicrobiota bacterium]